MKKYVACYQGEQDQYEQYHRFDSFEELLADLQVLGEDTTGYQVYTEFQDMCMYTFAIVRQLDWTVINALNELDWYIHEEDAMEDAQAQYAGEWFPCADGLLNAHAVETPEGISYLIEDLRNQSA